MNGNREQPTNFAGSQLLRQVFGGASFWWGLLYRYKCKWPLLFFTKGGLWHQRDGRSRASFLLEGHSKPVAP